MDLEEARLGLRDAQAYLKWIQSFGMYSVPDDAFPLSASGGLGAQPPKAPARKSPAGAPSDQPASGGIREEEGGYTEGGEGARPPSVGHEHGRSGGGGPLSGKGTKDERLDRLTGMVKNCDRCRLCETALNGVFGEGDRSADLMFIGEAPGANEDKQGRPFVGQAGRVLTGELEKHGITREEVFITNLVKHRPPENRDPLPDEIEACAPYLHEQIELIKPKMLCGLGRFACAALLGGPIKIMQIRGTWAEYRGVPLFICLHPSAVLHQKANRTLFDQDIAALAARYHEVRGGR